MTYRTAHERRMTTPCPRCRLPCKFRTRSFVSTYYTTYHHTCTKCSLLFRKIYYGYNDDTPEVLIGAYCLRCKNLHYTEVVESSNLQPAEGIFLSDIAFPCFSCWEVIKEQANESKSSMV